MKASGRGLRRVWPWLGVLCVALLLGLVLTNRVVERAAVGRHFSSVSDLPARKVALVLGTSPSVAGRPNPYYTARMDAAAALYRAGKAQAFILSGDNSTRFYDEPSAMKRDLIARGIPAARLYLDDAGFRTLDSVVRAQKIFGQSSFVVVSQKFHNERAIFLARRRGLDAIGYDAADVVGVGGLKTQARELFARASAVLDVTLLKTQPKFLGAAIKIP
ncbi:YdcF family protein [Deinococcus sp. KNUC1210]|uniref:SanA/YdcF family protein n=1 Tax=Deinococcus sp. KNUC1210 TaxID=2917691 RepID=UPI001EEFA691|nr:ElyC/SanA/YdcF family protein [Deinococcus sp. KNUC1210]ULH14629.1 YdcF family protein [Deinococcus sp. KNUC1210]